MAIVLIDTDTGEVLREWKIIPFSPTERKTIYAEMRLSDWRKQEIEALPQNYRDCLLFSWVQALRKRGDR